MRFEARYAMREARGVGVGVQIRQSRIAYRVLLLFSIFHFPFSIPFTSPLNAQTRLEIQTAPGFVWAHNNSVAHLRPGRPLWLGLSLMPARWQRNPGLELYRQAHIGLTLGYIHFRYPAVMGQSLVPMAFFENQPRRWWFYRVSGGLAFNSHAYNLADNPFNTAIGAPIAWALQAQLGAEAHFSRSYLRAGLQITHLSNGAWRLPNSGINVPAAFLTLGLLRGQAAPLRPAATTDSLPLPRWHLNIIAAGSIKSADVYPAPYFLLGVFRLEAVRKIGSRSGLTFGVDAIYNPALPADYTQLDKPHPFPLRLGLTAGHDWFLTRQLAITTQLGGYVYNPYPTVHKPIYQRYGLRFQAAHRLSYAIWLRSHLGQADCVEWALQYRVWSAE